MYNTVNMDPGIALVIVIVADFRGHLRSQGLDPQSSTPAELAAHVQKELAKFAKIVQSGNIQPE